jgi:hypothetical protein
VLVIARTDVTPAASIRDGRQPWRRPATRFPCRSSCGRSSRSSASMAGIPSPDHPICWSTSTRGRTGQSMPSWSRAKPTRSTRSGEVPPPDADNVPRLVLPGYATRPTGVGRDHEQPTRQPEGVALTAQRLLERLLVETVTSWSPNVSPTAATPSPAPSDHSDSQPGRSRVRQRSTLACCSWGPRWPCSYCSGGPLAPKTHATQRRLAEHRDLADRVTDIENYLFHDEARRGEDQWPN